MLYCIFVSFRDEIKKNKKKRKRNALLKLINEQNGIDKIYLYATDLSEPKYEYLIKKLEDA